MTTRQIYNRIIRKNKGKHRDVLKKMMEERGKEKEKIATEDFDKAKDLNKKERGD